MSLPADCGDTLTIGCDQKAPWLAAGPSGHAMRPSRVSAGRHPSHRDPDCSTTNPQNISLVIVFFENEDDYAQGDTALNAMGRRQGVEGASVGRVGAVGVIAASSVSVVGRAGTVTTATPAAPFAQFVRCGECQTPWRWA